MVSGWHSSGTRQQRGYGANHDRERARLLPLAIGTPCPMCERIMTEDQRLQLDHVIPVALGGANGPKRIVHASCNLSAGQRLGIARQRAGRWARKQASRW